MGKYVCRGLFFLIGYIFDCHWVSFCGIGWGFAIGIQWVEATDAARHPKVPRAGPQQRIIWLKISIMLRLRNPASELTFFSSFPFTLSALLLLHPNIVIHFICLSVSLLSEGRVHILFIVDSPLPSIVPGTMKMMINIFCIKL